MTPPVETSDGDTCSTNASTPAARPAWLREAARAANEHRWQSISPTRHNLLNLTILALLCSGLAAMPLLVTQLGPLAYVAVAAPCIGILLYAVFILALHESGHGMFVLAADRERAKRWNRRVGFMAGLVLLSSFERSWIQGHLVHHRATLVQDEDPQQAAKTFKGRKLAIIAFILLLIPGLAVLMMLVFKNRPPVWERVVAISAWAAFVLLTGMTLSWLVPLAFAWGFNVTMLLNLLRLSQEHGSDLHRYPHPEWRTRSYFLPFRWLLSPLSIHYHFEHHTCPGVPWYRLRTVHRIFVAATPERLRPLVYTRGVGEVWQQMRGERPNAPVSYWRGDESPTPKAAL